MQGKGSEDLFAAFLWKLIVLLHLGNLWRCIIDIPVVILSYHFVFYMLSNRAPVLLSWIDLLLHICNQRIPSFFFLIMPSPSFSIFCLNLCISSTIPRLYEKENGSRSSSKIQSLYEMEKKRNINSSNNPELVRDWLKWDLISSISFKIGLLRNCFIFARNGV